MIESICLQLGDIKTLATHPIANPVLQILVAIPEHGQTIIDTLFEEGDEKTEDFIKFLIQDRVGSHLIEKVVQNASSSSFKSIYKSFFRARLVELCAHPISNFVVQSLISSTRKESQYEEMLDLIVPHFEEFIFGSASRSGIVVKVIESAIKYPEQQKKCTNAILKAFHAVEADRRPDLANLILNFRTWEVYILTDV